MKYFNDFSDDLPEDDFCGIDCQHMPIDAKYLGKSTFFHGTNDEYYIWHGYIITAWYHCGNPDDIWILFWCHGKLLNEPEVLKRLYNSFEESKPVQLTFDFDYE